MLFADVFRRILHGLFINPLSAGPEKLTDGHASSNVAGALITATSISYQRSLRNLPSPQVLTNLLCYHQGASLLCSHISPPDGGGGGVTMETRMYTEHFNFCISSVFGFICLFLFDL